MASSPSRSGLRSLHRAGAFLAAVGLGALLVTGISGCSKKSGKGGDGEKKTDLPALSIDESTVDLMLTWIDSRGGTHVESSPARVPEEGRKLVRVIIRGDDAGTGDPIYVADLTKRGGDGKFGTSPMSRREWEDEIERRRGARIASLPEGEADEQGGPSRHNPESGHLEPAVPDVPPGHPTPGDPGGPNPIPDPGNKDAKNLKIIIYGASWCGPCHMAMKHLDQRHIAYTFKDVDKDSGAASEMSAKLSKAGTRGGGIPVIDIGGRLMVGYEVHQMDSLIDQATGGTTL